MNDVRLSVVLADDVAEYRLLLRVLLESDGRFEIVGEAADGAEAIATCGREHPDLVLLDLAMPIMDGLQAIPGILARSPRTRIIVLSGFARAELEPQALASGASAYLEKGEDLHDLATAVLNLVRAAGTAATPSR